MGGLRLHALTPIHTTGAYLHLRSLRTIQIKTAEYKVGIQSCTLAAR